MIYATTKPMETRASRVQPLVSRQSSHLILNSAFSTLNLNIALILKTLAIEPPPRGAWEMAREITFEEISIEISEAEFNRLKPRLDPSQISIIGVPAPLPPPSTQAKPPEDRA